MRACGGGGRGFENVAEVEAAAGRARQLAVTARGAEAARGMATVLNCAPLSHLPSLSPSPPPSLH